jgi:hypothetical protein
MSVQIHADSIDIAVAALESDVVRNHICFFSLMGFADQEYTAAFARTVLQTVGFESSTIITLRSFISFWG